MSDGGQYVAGTGSGSGSGVGSSATQMRPLFRPVVRYQGEHRKAPVSEPSTIYRRFARTPSDVATL